MKVSEKVTKTEALLLAMTLVFLLLTGAIFVLRSRSGGAEYVVRNETMRAAEEETPPASVLEEEPPVPLGRKPAEHQYGRCCGAGYAARYRAGAGWTYRRIPQYARRFFQRKKI